MAVRRAKLTVPLEDFEHLPAELGCSLHRKRDALVLAGDQPGCWLEFVVEAGAAVLHELCVEDDEGGQFAIDVVGLLFQVYGGDLSADLRWQPELPHLGELEILEGDTASEVLTDAAAASLEPLPASEPQDPLDDAALERLERFLAEAEAAWAEYQALKPGHVVEWPRPDRLKAQR